MNLHRSFVRPQLAEQAKVTSKILEKFARTTDATTVVAFTVGEDDDPVIAAAQSMGLRVVDLRPDETRNESDDFYPFDTHPGPISHFNYYLKMRSALESLGISSVP